MRERLSHLVVLALACLICSGPSFAEDKRVALVIGNSEYKNTPQLANPKNDAIDIAAALRKMNFTVIEGQDLDKAGMERKIRDFASALRDARTGLFFYAGHGLQVGGQNYLVPVDAELTAASAIDFEMLRLDLIQRTMEREAGTNILIIDACAGRDEVRDPLCRLHCVILNARGRSDTTDVLNSARMEELIGAIEVMSNDSPTLALTRAWRESAG